MKKLIILLLVLLQTVTYGQIFRGKFTPKGDKILLTLGQDLYTLAGYRYGKVMPPDYPFNLKAGEGPDPEPGAAVAYISFYNNLVDEHNINYGALGMDNSGNLTGKDTDWGAGPLNAASTADGWNHSALILALSMTEHWNENGLSKIANGTYDQNIKKIAMFCNKYSHKKIYMRIGYEFDGRWNGYVPANWGTSNQSPFAGGYQKTDDYKAAYRRIVDVLRQEGVKNVAYVWQSCTAPGDDVLDAWYDFEKDLVAAHENIEDWYPGDDYVDWVGMSWFVSPKEADDFFGYTEVPNLLNQDDLAEEMLDFARKKHKPVMIAEASFQGYDVLFPEAQNPTDVSRVSTGWAYEGAKVLFEQGLEAAEKKFKAGTWFDNLSAEDAWNRWFKEFFDFIYKNKNIIRAVNYINSDWNSQYKFGFNEEIQGYVEGYWGDARVEVNPEIKKRWLAEITKDIWLNGSPNINDHLEDVPTSINNQANLQTYSLELNHRVTSAASPKVTINYKLPQNSKVKVSIHALNGKLMKTLTNTHLNAGQHSVTWQAVAPGLYFYQVQVDNTINARKLLLK